MKNVATPVRVLFGVLALTALVAGAAFAQTAEPVTGHQPVSPIQYESVPVPTTIASTIVYDATNQAVSAGTSSTDLAAIYGDECVILPAGLGQTLTAMKFAVFCSSSSTANLTSATETIRFYDLANAGAYIGGYNTTLGAIARGFYSIYTVTNLDPLAIAFPSQDIVVTQQLSNVVGATRMGTVVSYANAPAVGSTNNGFYQSNASAAAGWYLITGQTYSNLQYELETAEAPVPTHSKTWGSVKALYR